MDEGLQARLAKTPMMSLIAKKRDGHPLSDNDIELFVQGVTHEAVVNEQIGAMLMAIFLNGMSAHETNILTQAMLRSGEQLSWPQHAGLVVDKHSTGGVGDKVSLPLVAALAANGVKVPMISGRGLGHTGGTLDKLEAIPGFSVSQSAAQMSALLDTVGCCIVGQTATLVPADRVLYAIRDITSTVESIPLISSSIVSKKLAEGLNALILDVKFGRAAFMKSLDKARELAASMQAAGQAAGVATVAMLTAMDHPIGLTIGNALEVLESVECLQGKGPADLEDLVCAQGGHLLHLAHKAVSPAAGAALIQHSLHNGAALAKFEAMVAGQSGDAAMAVKLCRDPALTLPRAPFTTDIMHLGAAGFVVDIDAIALANYACGLGAGRRVRTDQIDFAVGLQLLVTVGQTLVLGQAWLRVHHRQPIVDAVDHALLAQLITTNVEAPAVRSRIFEVIA